MSLYFCELAFVWCRFLIHFQYALVLFHLYVGQVCYVFSMTQLCLEFCLLERACLWHCMLNLPRSHAPTPLPWSSPVCMQCSYCFLSVLYYFFRNLNLHSAMRPGFLHNNFKDYAHKKIYNLKDTRTCQTSLNIIEIDTPHIKQ